MDPNNKWPYCTRQWRRLRAAKLAQDPLCAICGKLGRLRPATMVDHVQPIEQGGEPWALENLQSLCQACHNVKTARTDQGKPLKGCDVDGGPCDPGHWWAK